MENRLDTKQLEQAAKKADASLNEAIVALSKYLSLLTVEERQRAVKPPEAFTTAGKALARAVQQHPAIAASTSYSAEAVLEDLANVEVLAPLSQKAEKLTQLLADARLTWLAEAYLPSLQVYGVAKVIAKQNAEVQELVEPLKDVFGTRRERKDKQENKQEK